MVFAELDELLLVFVELLGLPQMVVLEFLEPLKAHGQVLLRKEGLTTRSLARSLLLDICPRSPS